MSELAIFVTAKNNASGALKQVKGDLAEVEKAGKSASQSLKDAGKGMTDWGKGLSLGLTAPILAIGAAAIKAGNELDRGMANIESLNVAGDRVKELKENVKDMQIQFGTSAENLTNGLYQIISAFGDTADTSKVLEANLKVAAAGAATLTEAVDLTSAVTLAWNDTSLEAIQHVGDMALKAVELGKTNLPELAASIGKVTSMTKGMNISQEEMFSVFATASGVVGGTAEVATGYRGILQSLQNPTEAMTGLLKAQGYASGDAMVKALGFQTTLDVIAASAKAAGTSLTPYISSVEGSSLAIALATDLHDRYSNALKGESDATGKTNAAYKSQANTFEFAMNQIIQAGNVFLEDIKDGLTPTLLSFADAIQPLVAKMLTLSMTFAAMDPSTQAWIIGIAAAAAAVGPLLVVLGTVVGALGSVAPLFASVGAAAAAIVSPIGLVVIALGALTYYNWDSIKSFANEILPGIQAAAPLAGTALLELGAQLTGIGLDTYDTTEGIQAFVTALTGSQSAGIAAGESIASIGETIARIASAVPLAGAALGELVAQLTGVGLNTYDTTEGIEAFVTALTGSQSAAATASSAVLSLVSAFAPIQAALAPLGDRFQTMIAGLGSLSPQLSALGQSFVGLWTAAQPALTALGELIANVLGAAAVVSINLLGAAFQNIVPVISASLSQVAAIINVVATTVAGMTQIVTALMQGDFAGAFAGAQTIADGFSTYIQTTFTNLSTVIGAVLSTITTTISGAAANLGFPEISTQIDAIQAKVSSGWLSIKDTVAVTIAEFKWSDYITQLADWGTWIKSLDWAGFVTELTDWAAFIGQLEWSGFVTAVTWASFITSIDLGSYIPDFPGWKALVSGFIPSSVSSGASSVGSAIGGAYNSAVSAITGRAMGTGGFEGGWTWVGERGPELMQLPRGTKIMSNHEANGYVANNAGGNTAASDAIAKATAYGNKLAAETATKENTKANKELTKAMAAATKAQEQAIQDLKGALQQTPGLFGASQVTQKQMDMAKLGIPQNFADDWLRHLTDEVLHGVQWKDADIKDAALRAGLDPSLPAKALLEMVTDKWNDSSLFAGGKNTDLINVDAVKKSLADQAAAKSGQASLMAMFGIKPDRVAGQASALSGQFIAGLATGITPESTAPVGTAIVSGVSTALADPKNSLGTDLASMFNAQLDDKDNNPFATTGATILKKITDSWGDVTKTADMIGAFAKAMDVQVGTDSAIQALKSVGGQIAKIIFQGYDEWMRDSANFTGAVNSANIAQKKAATPDAGNNASGTSSWRGGLTWLGEAGMELLRMPNGGWALAGAGGPVIRNLPKGTQIFNHQDSMRMIGNNASGTTTLDMLGSRRQSGNSRPSDSKPPVVINMTLNATINNEIDVRMMASKVAYEAAKELQRRR